MFERVIIYPYDIKSESARAIKKALVAERVPCLLVYPDGQYVPKRRHFIMNWGNSTVPRWDQHGERPIRNDPAKVAYAVNKLQTLDRLSTRGVRVPRFTTSPNQAIDLLRHGVDLVARTKLNASEGEGAHFVEAPDSERALTTFQVGYTGEGRVQLWTEYIPKFREFRIHVFGNNVIFTQEKKRRLDLPNGTQIDEKIRSHSRGWVLAHNDLDPIPASVLDAAVAAVRGLELDFGACDIVFNDRRNDAFVLEVNTAPGLEGATVDAYKTAILRELR